MEQLGHELVSMWDADVTGDPLSVPTSLVFILGEEVYCPALGSVGVSGIVFLAQLESDLPSCLRPPLFCTRQALGLLPTAYHSGQGSSARWYGPQLTLASPSALCPPEAVLPHQPSTPSLGHCVA